MAWKIGLAGYERDIPKPDKFSVGMIEIARSERTASGRLVKDIVAQKRVFKLSYKGIPASDVAILREEYERRAALSFVYEDEGQTKTATVWFTDFERERLETQAEFWKVDITLEEQ